MITQKYCANAKFQNIFLVFSHLILNVDAAIRHNSSYIAVIARDGKGEICKAFLKDLSTIEPSTTKVAAIKWALELAKLEKYTQIIVESDTKVCVDAINGRFDYADWRIIDIYTEAKLLVSEFAFHCFCWVKRDTNSVAHELFKLAASLCLPLVVISALSLPPLLRLGKEISCFLLRF